MTIRERDTMKQERVALDRVAGYVGAFIKDKRNAYPRTPEAVRAAAAA